MNAHLIREIHFAFRQNDQSEWKWSPINWKHYLNFQHNGWAKHVAINSNDKRWDITEIDDFTSYKSQNRLKFAHKNMYIYYFFADVQ